MVKIVSPISQREVEAIAVDFEVKTEPWVRVSLDDGSVLKIRTIVTGVTRLKGEHDPSGNPMYVVNHNSLIRVISAPKELRGSPTAPGSKPTSTTPTGGPEIR